MTNRNREVRDWLFRGIMFEADAEQFRQAGIRIGADQRSAEQSLLEEVLSPFGVDLRNDALNMSRLYALVYCFENSVRGLIIQRLNEMYGSDWWNLKIPKKVKDFSDGRRKASEKNSWLEGATNNPLGFVQFGHLGDIIIDNWVDFTDLIPSQHWLIQRLDEMEKARNFIAHNRALLSSEFQRIEMYVNDWNRQVGL